MHLANHHSRLDNEPISIKIQELLEQTPLTAIWIYPINLDMIYGILPGLNSNMQWFHCVRNIYMEREVVHLINKCIIVWTNNCRARLSAWFAINQGFPNVYALLLKN